MFFSFVLFAGILAANVGAHAKQPPLTLERKLRGTLKSKTRRLFEHSDPSLAFEVDGAAEGFCPGDTVSGRMLVTGAGGVTVDPLPMDVVISVDNSGSMGGSTGTTTKMEEAKTAARYFVNKMALDGEPTSKAGIVAWQSWVFISQGLTNPPDHQSVHDAIDGMSAGGGTNLNAGLQGAYDILLSSSTSVKAVVFLTDGYGTYTSCGSSGSVADLIASIGGRIYAIGYGSNAAMTPLNDMAACTGGQAYTAALGDLDAIFDLIYQEIALSTVPTKITVTLEPNPETTLEFSDPEHVAPGNSACVVDIDHSSGLQGGDTWSDTFEITVPDDDSLFDTDIDLVDFSSSTMDCCDAADLSNPETHSLASYAGSLQVHINSALACCDVPCGKDDKKILICHVPPGNEGNEHSICVAPSAVAAHFDHHVDYCGECGGRRLK